MKTNHWMSREPVRALLILIGLVCFLAVLPNMSTAPASSVSTAPRSAPAGSVLAGASALGSNAIGEPGFALSPMAAMLTATKTDQLQTDVNMNGKADPGDTLMYTVTITNSGAMDATNVMFSDMIDSNTTLVGGSVTASPIAVNDSYSTIGNVNIQVPAAQGVLVNDLNPNGPLSQLTITASDSASTSGGTVSVNASDGSFTYNPPAGFTGSDTFTYTLGNGTGKTNTGTVTITVSGLIWFVNSAAGTNGDGRLSSPFNILTGAGSADAVDGANDVIFLYSSATNYAGGMTLTSGEKVIGQGAGASILSITGFSAPSGTNMLPATGMTNPTVTAAVNNIVLGTGNTIRGVTLQTSAATATALKGTSFGTLFIGEVGIVSTGPALDLATGTLTGPSSTANFSGGVATSGATGTGINLASVAGAMFSLATSASNTTGMGINIVSSSANFDFQNTSVTNNGGTGVKLGGAGTGNTGTISFLQLNITPNSGQRGLQAVDNTMTITATSGTINATGATAVEITRSSSTTPLMMSLTSVSANGGSNGIFLKNTSGSFTVSGDGSNTSVGGNSTGGTISNMTGADGATTGIGVYLENVTNVTLQRMTINGTNQNFGVRGFTVNGFTLQYSTVGGTNGTNGAIDSYGEGSVYFGGASGATGLTGSGTVTNCNISGGRARNLSVVNTSGTLDRLIITGTTFGLTNSASDNDSLAVEARNSGTVANVTVTGSTFAGAAGDICDFTGQTSTTMDVIFGGVTATPGVAPGNMISNNHPNNIIGGGGMTFATQGSMTFHCIGNTFRDANGSAITLQKASAGTLLSGFFDNNSIGASGVVGSGSATGNGIFCSYAGTGTASVTITNNQIHRVNGNFHISADNTGGSYTAKFDIRGNSFDTPGTGNAGAVGMTNGSPGSSDTVNVCAVIGGSAAGDKNTLAGFSGQSIFLGSSGANGGHTFNLPGLPVSTEAAVESFVAGNNTMGGSAVDAFADSPATFTAFTGVGTNCSTPSSLSGVGESISASAIARQPSADQSISDNYQECVLRASRGEAPKNDNVEKLSEHELTWIVQAALERWRQTGISREDLARLEAVTFELADLPLGELAATDSTRVKIDETAAGYGWYFDQFPMEENEFEVLVPNRELQTTDMSPADRKIDLLTVVMREFGSACLLGKDRVPENIRKNMRPLMENTLSPGVRRLPLDQLRTTVSPVGSIKPVANQSLIAQSNATVQRLASQASDRPVASQVERSAMKSAVRNKSSAVINSLLQPAVMKIDNSASASSHRANRVMPVAAFKPAMVPDVTIGPFTVPPGESVTIMFSVTINTPVTPAGTTQVCNQGTVTADGPISVMTDDPDVGGAADPTCTTLAQADLEITAKNDSPDTEVPAGDNITYTINFKNNGPDTANNVKVTDPLPANTTLVSVTPPMGWTRTDSVIVGGTGTIMFEKATVASMETASFTIVVKVGAATPAATIISNTASTTSDTPDGTQANNSKTATTTVTALADLAITKTDNVTTVVPGMPATYTITVTNNGPDQVTGATVADTFPAALTGVTFTSSAMGGATGNTSSGSGNINDTVTMPSGSTITYVVTGTVNPAATGSLVNTATVTEPAGVTDPNQANNSATDTDTLTPEADLAVTKSDSPDPVVAGNNITYTINFSNNGPSDAQNVTVTDAVPANTTFVSAAVTTGSGWSTSAPAVGGTGNVVFSKATVAASETAVFTIVVKVNADTANGSTVTNTANAATTTADPNTGNDSSTATTTVQTQADLAVTKSDAPDPVTAGNNITYTINFINNGPSDAQTVTVTDAVPASATFVSASVTMGSGWSTSAPAVGGTGNVVFSKATVAAEETATFQIVVKVSADTVNGSTITNTATAASVTTDPATSNDSATATTTVSAQADLSVSKSDSPDPVTAGNNITYTINFTNNGPSDAQTVTVTDAVPANTTFVSAMVTSGSGWSTSAPAVGGTGNVVFSKATVAAGETAVFTIVVKVNSSAGNGSTITNTATAASATADSTPGDNSSTSTTTVQTQADLAVTKSDSPDPVIPGNNITYTINFTNNGPSDAQTVTVTDAVAANTAFVSASVTMGSGWSTSAPAVGSTGNVLFSKATVAAGETATFQIVVNVNAGTPNNTIITNTATAGSNTTDPTPGNSSATTTTMVVSEADLAVTKSDAPDPACVMGNITYTISFTNNGPGLGINTMVTDAVPANTTFVSAAAPGGWSTSAPAVGGTGSVVFSKASVGMGETATFQIVVKVDGGTLSGAMISNTATASSSISDPVPGNNSGTSTTTVDPIAPMISCPANVTATVSGGGSVTYPAPMATDNCSAPAVVCTPPSGGVFPLGTTTVTCTATDAAGNTASCSFTVTTFDICLQDDSSASRVLLWNSQTGDYVFCLSGAKISGRGTVASQGNIFKLTHNALDRRLLAQVDKAFGRGTASLQMPPGQTILSMIDRDIRNNACACSLP